MPIHRFAFYQSFSFPPQKDYEDLKKNHCLPQRRQHLRSKGGKAEDQVTWQSSCQQNERIPGGKRPETARNPTEPLSDRTTTEPGKPPTHWRYSRWRQHRGYRFSWNEVVEMVRPLRKVKFGGLLMAGYEFWFIHLLPLYNVAPKPLLPLRHPSVVDFIPS